MSLAPAIAAAYPKSAPIAEEIERVAISVGAHPYDLANLIHFESGGTFSPSVRNPSSRAVGLIQFHPKHSMKSVGLSADQLAKLSAYHQMAYVQRYLDNVRGPHKLNTPHRLFMAVFYPVAMKWRSTKRFPSNVLEANPGIATPSDYVRFATRSAKLPSSDSGHAPPVEAMTEGGGWLPELPVFPSFELPELPSMPVFDLSALVSRSGTWTNRSPYAARLLTDQGPIGPGEVNAGGYKIEVNTGSGWTTLPKPVTVDAGGKHVLQISNGRWKWQ